MLGRAEDSSNGLQTLGRVRLDHPADDHSIPRLGPRRLHPSLYQGLPDLAIGQATAAKLLGLSGDRLVSPPAGGADAWPTGTGGDLFLLPGRPPRGGLPPSP